MLSARPAGTAPAGAKALPEARRAPGREQTPGLPSTPHLRGLKRGEQQAPKAARQQLPAPQATRRACPGGRGAGSAAGRADTGQPRTASPPGYDASMGRCGGAAQRAVPSGGLAPQRLSRAETQGPSRPQRRRGPPAPRGSPSANHSALRPAPSPSLAEAPPFPAGAINTAPHANQELSSQ